MKSYQWSEILKKGRSTAKYKAKSIQRSTNLWSSLKKLQTQIELDWFADLLICQRCPSPVLSTTAFEHVNYRIEAGLTGMFPAPSIDIFFTRHSFCCLMMRQSQIDELAWSCTVCASVSSRRRKSGKKGKQSKSFLNRKFYKKTITELQVSWWLLCDSKLEIHTHTGFIIFGNNGRLPVSGLGS